MILLTVEGAKRLQEKMRKQSKLVRPELERFVHWAGFRMLRELKLQFSNKLVRVRTGHARSSLRAKIEKRNLVARVGSNLIYMRMIEYGTKGLPGGVLRPKKARLLTIPLPAAKTKAGVARKARDYYDTRWTKSKEGKPILMGKKSPQGKTIALFAGAKKVKIKGRQPFEKTEKKIGPIIRRVADRRIQRILNL